MSDRETRPENTRAPDVPGVVVGWRTWQIRDPERVRLRSPLQVATEWPGGGPLTARCELRGHPAPDPGCTCGLYAARDPADVGGVGFGRVTLLGCVALWGTVVEGERGWRGGLGLPVVLFCGPALPPTARAELAEVYRVPVHPLDRPVALAVERHGIGGAGELLRVAASGTPPDPLLIDDAAHAFVRAVADEAGAGRAAAGRAAAGRAAAGRAGADGRAPAGAVASGAVTGGAVTGGAVTGRAGSRMPTPGRTRRRFTVGTAVLAALAASALLLPRPDTDEPPAAPPGASAR